MRCARHPQWVRTRRRTSLRSRTWARRSWTAATSRARCGRAATRRASCSATWRAAHTASLRTLATSAMPVATSRSGTGAPRLARPRCWTWRAVFAEILCEGCGAGSTRRWRRSSPRCPTWWRRAITSATGPAAATGSRGRRTSQTRRASAACPMTAASSCPRARRTSPGARAGRLAACRVLHVSAQW